MARQSSKRSSSKSQGKKRVTKVARKRRPKPTPTLADALRGFWSNLLAAPAKPKRRKVQKRTKRQKPLTRSQTRTFHKNLGKLKLQGLLPSNVDPKTAKPSRALRERVKLMEPVIKGKATAHKIRPSEKRYYQRKGYKTGKGFVFLPTEPGSKIKVEGKTITRVTQLPGDRIMEVVELPIHPKNIPEFIEQLRTDKSLENLKAANESWAFRYHGNQSRRTFTNLELLVDWLMNEDRKYNSIKKGYETGKRKYLKEIEALEIIRVKKGKWEIPNVIKFKRVNKAGRNA